MNNVKSQFEKMKTTRLLKKFKRFIQSKVSTIPHVYNLRPTNPLPLPETDHLETKEDIYRWVEFGIDCFREWYQPVDFGNGIIAHVTIPPEWNFVPSLLNDNHRGLSKWNHIIKKHIPDVAGKRVLDLGCSSGLYCLELARMGAKEVIGIDRSVEINHKSTTVPPTQDVITQAKFVKKSFELLEGVEYPIQYIAHDIANLDELDLGKFDLILASCVIYHELGNMVNVINQLATMTDHIILQANQVHTGELGKYSDKMFSIEGLLNAGFTYVETDAPNGYSLPLIVGRK